MPDLTQLGVQSNPSPIRVVGGVIYFLLLLLLFFVSIELMGTAFEMFGGGFADQLLSMASNPVAGLFIGFLATSLWDRKLGSNDCGPGSPDVQRVCRLDLLSAEGPAHRARDEVGDLRGPVEGEHGHCMYRFRFPGQVGGLIMPPSG